MIHSLRSGGAERVTVTLANHWAQRGEEIRIVCLSAQEPPFYSLHGSIDLVHLDLALDSSGVVSAVSNNLRRIRAVRSAIADFGADFAIGIMTSMNVLTILACMGQRTKAVATEHIHPPEFPLGRLWELGRKLAYARADLVTAPTDLTSRWLEDVAHAKHVRSIPNPISVPLPRGEPLVPVETWLEEGRRLLLATGRLCHQKGFDLLIPAFANLAADFPDWKLAILGEGDDRTPLQALIDRHDCQDQIVLVGAVGNVSDWYFRAEAFVLSSRFEGFGNTLAEAMAHGCACVSFDCDAGPSQIIRSEEDGILVPNGDTDALERALARVLADDGFRTKLRSNGDKARARFGEDQVVDRWDEMLASVA